MATEWLRRLRSGQNDWFSLLVSVELEQSMSDMHSGSGREANSAGSRLRRSRISLSSLAVIVVLAALGLVAVITSPSLQVEPHGGWMPDFSTFLVALAGVCMVMAPLRARRRSSDNRHYRPFD
ncbi:hypothetical protein KX816_12290 [Sphingosinicellaceae bacterium]|nr:hypothetical protein KX816_12290 [Sphingosinicellaceae bacterium]